MHDQSLKLSSLKLDDLKVRKGWAGDYGKSSNYYSSLESVGFLGEQGGHAPHLWSEKESKFAESRQVNQKWPGFFFFFFLLFYSMLKPKGLRRSPQFHSFILEKREVRPEKETTFQSSKGAAGTRTRLPALSHYPTREVKSQAAQHCIPMSPQGPCFGRCIKTVGKF